LVLDLENEDIKAAHYILYAVKSQFSL